MIALGYTMVYGVLQLINFAHSEVFMVGTFAGLYTLKAVASGPEGGVVLAGVIGTAMLAAMGASALTALGLE
ncbi:MAG TPA: branched-chain amino acid ABC transporter permease, partial [Actinomycetota bacterium]|nr:branched-chain amino acid ABC transporter permease [Actinomycetota bacterium]